MPELSVLFIRLIGDIRQSRIQKVDVKCRQEANGAYDHMYLHHRRGEGYDRGPTILKNASAMYCPRRPTPPAPISRTPSNSIFWQVRQRVLGNSQGWARNTLCMDSGA